MQREVLRDEVPLPDEVVLLDADGTEVVVDDGQDALQALATLRTGGVIDHVSGDEIVNGGSVTCKLAPEQLLDDILRAP